MESVTTAAASRDQFLQLLVTQLRHQDPLEPTKQEDFLAQLAQFSTLEGIEKLNDNFDGFLNNQLESQTQQNSFLVELQQFQNVASAANMVGKEVQYLPPGAPENGPLAGRVEAVVIQQENVSLRVDGKLVPIEQVQEIRASSAPTVAEDLGLSEVAETSLDAAP